MQSLHPGKRHRLRLPPRHGFTLIETVVAILLIDVALLALVAAGAVAVRQSGDLARRRRATELAESRVESLAAQPCGGAVGGDSTPELGMNELWSSGLPVSGVRQVVDSIELPLGSGTDRIVLRTMVPC